MKQTSSWVSGSLSRSGKRTTGSRHYHSPVCLPCSIALLHRLKGRSTGSQGNADTREMTALLSLLVLCVRSTIMEYLPPRRQTLVFSATFSASLESTLERLMHSPMRVRLDAETPSLLGISQFWCEVKDGEGPLGHDRKVCGIL